jgi:hypothetical protein
MFNSIAKNMFLIIIIVVEAYSQLASFTKLIFNNFHYVRDIIYHLYDVTTIIVVFPSSHNVVIKWNNVTN